MRPVLALAGAVALGPGSGVALPQASLDRENRYPAVGVIMVWRVDDAGRPVELRGFASGTLIAARVMVTAGHFTAPATSLDSLPPSIRLFASFSPNDAKNPRTWIRVVDQVTHPSMPHCPPPPQCDPTDDVLVAPLQPGIADVGLVILEQAPIGITPAGLAPPGTLDRSEGATTTIVGYGMTTPRPASTAPDFSLWDGKRRVRRSALRRVVDETWALWAVPSYVCSGDSGGGMFLSSSTAGTGSEVLVASVSDGGRDCRRQNNNNRLDTRSVQDWIHEALRSRGLGGRGRRSLGAHRDRGAHAHRMAGGNPAGEDRDEEKKRRGSEEADRVGGAESGHQEGREAPRGDRRNADAEPDAKPDED
jgi:hypothetical protein